MGNNHINRRKFINLSAAGTGAFLASPLISSPVNIFMVNQSESAVSKPIGSIVKNNMTWESFLSRHDLVWNRLPKTWMEGAFIGNGRLGAMIYKGDDEAEPGAKVLAWTIGRSDVYDEREPELKDSGKDWGNYTRLPIGRFHICPVGEVKDGDLRIDLWNGEAHGTIRTDRGEIRWRSWTQEGDAENGVVIVDLETDEGEKGYTWKWQAFRSMNPRYFTRPPETGTWSANPDGRRADRDGTQVWVQPLLAGGDYSTAWKEVRQSETKRILFVSVGYALHQGGSADLAMAAIAKATQQKIEVLQKGHRDWWHAFYSRSFLSIPDARIESHYWIQLYKLASATRSGGVVADLCGPWLKVDTVWPACWWNLNMQLIMYPVPVSNHLELGEPLFALLRQELENGTLIRNAPENMRHDSAYFGNPTTTTDLRNGEVYYIGPGITGQVKQGARLNHLPWICHTLWEHYRRNMDDEVLRETLFPLTRRAFNFIFHFMEEGDDGRLHIQNTFSSEYGVAYDANEAIAMVTWGCQTLLWMSDRLKIVDPDIPRWKDILKRMVAPPVDHRGLMIGSDTSFEKSHRHYSHLMSLVPFRTWNFEDKEARALAYKSLDHFLGLSSNLQGYSYTGASSMYSMLGDGDNALKCLHMYLKGWDRPNTMYTESNPPSPVMETPLSAARCVQDMLLQSHDVIRIFPAVPSDWRDATFDKLLAEGAFEVSAARRNSSTQFIRIRSLAGEPCHVKTDMDNPMRLTDKGLVKVPVNNRGILILDLAMDEEAVLINKGFNGDLSIDQIELDPQDCNYYGLNKHIRN